MATLGLAPPHFVGLDASRPGPRPRNPQTAPDSGAVFLCLRGARSRRRTISAHFVLPQVVPGGWLSPAGRGRKGAVSHVGRGLRRRGAPRRLTQSFYERFTPGFERCSRRLFRTRNVLQTHAVVPPGSALPSAPLLPHPPIARPHPFRPPASPATIPDLLHLGCVHVFRLWCMISVHIQAKNPLIGSFRL